MHIHGGDIYGRAVELDFSANLNFLGMPDAVRQAAKEGVDAAVHYPDPQCRALRAALSKAEGVPAEQILCGNGAADLIFGLALAVKPKKALVWAPGFHEYEQALRAVDCQVEFLSLRKEEDFAYQSESLGAVTPETDMLFFCNPQNPTGQNASPDFLAALLDRCQETGTLCVVDECFLEFLDEENRFSVKPALAYMKNLFVLKAFTKLYAMPGLRLGYGLCAGSDLLQRMREALQPWNVSLPAQRAGVAALGETEYVRRTQALIRQERRFLKDALRELDCRIYGSKANFVFFQGPEDLASFCLERGILIRDCRNYQGLGPGYYRVAVRSREENTRLLEVFRERMA